MSGERTEAASPRRRMEARRQGLVPRSAMASSVATFCALIGWISYDGPAFVKALANFTRNHLISAGDTNLMSAVPFSDLLQIGGRGLLLCFGGAFLGGMASGGWLWVPELVLPRWSRISPWGGWQRLVSITAFHRANSWLSAVLAVTTALIWTVIQDSSHWTTAGAFSPEQLPDWYRSVMIPGGIRLCLCFSIAAIVEMTLRRHHMQSQLATTPNDRAQERRANEIHPETKRRQRQR